MLARGSRDGFFKTNNMLIKERGEPAEEMRLCVRTGAESKVTCYWEPGLSALS